MIFKRNITLLFFLLLFAAAQSQRLNYSNLRSKKLSTKSTLLFDSLSIVPGSFFVRGLDTTFYHIDEVNATLSWKKNPLEDSVDVHYRVFPYKLNAIAKRYAYDSVMNNFISSRRSFNNGYRQPSTASLFDFGTMNYNGSFGRSLSFGNSQDAVVNSQFNLQLSGMLGDSIQVAAAITDNNIPIQPDGNTQQLNEFDRVWLQFKKNGWEVNIGDIDLRQNQSYFLNFYKRLQGISYSNTSPVGAQGKNTVQLTGAIAKGKFTRNIFQGLEGNQGPYRLKGVNNEIFFIVLAGSERVFIDGQLLQRGEDQDYVINYNTAEITFTPRRMITKDSRIQVEFEYAERSYLNSMLYAADEIRVNKKLKLNVAAYSNSDAKNSPVNQTLDAKQRQFLNDVGDSTQNAFYPTAALDTFSVNKILYALKDTVVAGVTYSVYVYSTNPDSAKYNLGFIEIGVGRGNYVPDFNGANGKVYRWVAPINGLPQGNFEAATFLVAPKKQQVVTIGALYDLSSKTSLSSEVAMSNYDANTLSSKNKLDNKGFAGKVGLEHLLMFSGKKKQQLKVNAGYEAVEQSFRPLERLRTVEFYRDWGLDFQPAAATEHLPFTSLSLTDSAGNLLRLISSAYLRNDGYKGFRQQFQNDQQVKNWHVKAMISQTNFSGLINKGFFFRPSVEVSKRMPDFKNYEVGAAYSVERNEIKSGLSDSILVNSFAFDNLSAFIKSDLSKDNRWALTYFTRSDQLPLNNKLRQVNQSHNINVTTELLKNQHHQVRLNATYRSLQINQATLSTLQPEKTILGRFEYVINEWSGLVVGNVLYEAGAGQEQRRDFSYIEVPAGRGEYTWNDYNADGIPQLNEFEVALFPDQAKFIRVFTPTNQFVKANYTQFNYSFSINPRSITAKMKSKKWSNFIGRFIVQSSLQTAKKELSGGIIEFNPFKKGPLNDTSLITLSNIFANTLSFNRFSTRWGIDISNTRNFNKSLLTYGFESRTNRDWAARGRFNFAKAYTFELVQRLGYQSLFTPRFDNRNYDIQNISTEPRFTFTKGTSFRLQSSYQFVKKENQQAYGGEKSVNNSFIIESKYNAVNNTSLTGKFTYTKISYSGTPNSTVSYIMLDALLPGRNLLWNVDLTKRLGNNLELSFQYEGRKPAETRTIHIGRASLRAIL